MSSVVKILCWFALFLSISKAAEDFGSNWDSEPKCKLPGQSPVAIDSSKAVKDDSKGDVVFNWGEAAKPDDLFIITDGETAIIASEDSDMGSFGPTTVVDGVTFKMEAMNFHWGKEGSFIGSEHVVDLDIYNGEVEFVHLKDGINDVEEVLETPGNMMVVSVFLKEDAGASESRESASIGTALDEIVSQGKNMSGITSEEGKFSIGVFKTGDYFYRYTGTLTAKPCSPGTERIVLKEPLLVTPAFMAKFRKLKDRNNENFLESSVNRPLQELGDRIIYKNFD